MSELQQQAVRMINGMSDDNIRFLIEIIRRLMLHETYTTDAHSVKENMGIQAFDRLNAARSDIKQYLPDDFDPERA